MLQKPLLLVLIHILDFGGRNALLLGPCALFSVFESCPFQDEMCESSLNLLSNTQRRPLKVRLPVWTSRLMILHIVIGLSEYCERIGNR